VSEPTLVTRLRQRIDELLEQRDQARTERDQARASRNRWNQRWHAQRRRAEMWRARAMRRK
jgi:hypothetical protein